jgi:hypothetical protein
VPDRMRKAAGDPFEVGKDPITPLTVKPAERVGKIVIVIHEVSASATAEELSQALFRVVPVRLSRRFSA